MGVFFSSETTDLELNHQHQTPPFSSKRQIMQMPLEPITFDLGERDHRLLSVKMQNERAGCDLDVPKLEHVLMESPFSWMNRNFEHAVAARTE